MSEQVKLLRQLAEIYYAKPPATVYQHRDCGATARMFWDLVRSQTIEYKAEGDEGASIVDVYYCKHCGKELGYLQPEVKEQLLNPDYAKWERERQRLIRKLLASLLKRGFKVDSREGATVLICPEHGGFIEITPYGEGLYEREAGWYRFHDEVIGSQGAPCECVKIATKLKAVFR